MYVQSSSPSSQKKEECVLILQQMYVAFWPAACLLGMIGILLQFLLFYRGEGNGIEGIHWTESSMTKHSAMLLAFVYSGLAWTLSNGLVMNPKKEV